MIRTPRVSWLVLGVVGTLAVGRCTGPNVPTSDTDTGGSGGGSTSTGGSTATGGKGSGGSTTGGKSGAGGSTGTGGADTSGNEGTGGSMGGSPGTGGRATGGSPGTGGAGAGGAGTVTDPPCDNTVDNVAPSVDPPGGLAANRVPMFVMLGFDDNAYVDGINWVLDTLRTRKNSDGSAARATFFISAGFASDYFNPAGGQNAPDLLNAWRRMKTDGHEIANHSWSHSEMLAGMDKAGWQNELQKAQDLFVNVLGVEKCKLGGFRTPFLNFSQSTFDAFKAVGLKYDTSIEFGYDWWMPPGSDKGWGPGTAESGKHYYWPFTMNNAFPTGFFNKGVAPMPGVWEFPVYTFNKITGDTAATVTGFDFNLWTKAQNESSFNFTEVLKNSLDQRLAGNRSPFAVGAHTDIYSQFDASANTTWTNFNYQARRKALLDFIDYALTKPEVRLVTYRQLIAWLRKPTPL
ncbi:MAG TPA: polysaccharide deacetylase family protein [Polyangia bacterium]|nr:polysaccharide deacetylase family protein [Polyangia bacterium]